MYDHAVLHAALQQDEPTQPVFIFDKAILQRFSNKQDRRLNFIARTLCRMHEQLRQHDSGMLVLYGDAKELIPALADILPVSSVYSAEDFEPETKARDRQVKQTLLSGCRFVQQLDHVILHPEEAVKEGGDPYKVFTPYAKCWRSVLTEQHMTERTVNIRKPFAPFDDIYARISSTPLCVIDPADGAEAMLQVIGYELVEEPLWHVEDVQKRLSQFVGQCLKDYKDRRDILSDDRGTSRLSPYLRFGLISVRECLRLAIEHPGNGSDGWINELIWREFYQMILHHFPEVVEHEFQAHYRGALNWVRDETQWQAFQDGQTGYPVVDAAMRELKDTGWMHNRARMIVASFLTKDLLMDWRLGEEHFAQYLMDYELASNNGGWQWAASTGTDAQPYFRIFNPYLQSKKFDPDGTYIRRYVPELKEVENKQIHQPSPELCRKYGYPAAIVDHAMQRDKALAMFKQARNAA